MATNYTTPIGSTGFTDYIGPDGNNLSKGILHSFYLIGGHTEVPALTDLYEIPIAPDSGSVYAVFLRMVTEVGQLVEEESDRRFM